MHAHTPHLNHTQQPTTHWSYMLIKPCLHASHPSYTPPSPLLSLSLHHLLLFECLISDGAANLREIRPLTAQMKEMQE